MSQYPTLKLLERHGGAIAGAVSLAPVAAAIIALALGASPWWVVAGVFAAGVLYVGLRSYIELIRLMSDMLMPK
jgi:hypothetical protein